MTDVISGIKPRFKFVDTCGRSVAGMPGVAGAIREISAHWASRLQLYRPTASCIRLSTP